MCSIEKAGRGIEICAENMKKDEKSRSYASYAHDFDAEPRSGRAAAPSAMARRARPAASAHRHFKENRVERPRRREAVWTHSMNAESDSTIDYRL